MRTSEKFQTFVCPNDSITIEENGFTFTATIIYDEHYTIDDDDSHSTNQALTGASDELQSRILKARNAFYDNEWFYCGIVLSVSKNGIELGDNIASLWGIEANYPESDNAYLTEVSHELVEDVLYDKCKDLLQQHIEALTS